MRVVFQTARIVGACMAVGLGLVGCSSDSEPGYLRLSGPAPRLDSAPATAAHLVLFWATWCVPCREETPQLLALAGDLPETLGVVVFSHDESLEDVTEFFGGLPEPELHLRLDRDKAAAQAFGVETLPAAFLVVDGRLRARFDGPRRWDSPAMRRLLDRLLASGGESNP